MGPENKNCPLWKKPMSEVCHKCDWWRYMPLLDPKTPPGMPAQVINEYRCAVAWIPDLLMEVGKQQLSNAAATEGVRNQVAKTDVQSQAAIQTLITLLNRSMDIDRRAITNGGADEPKMLT
jgi:hypothetical protein